jgi:hypothetical protein
MERVYHTYVLDLGPEREEAQDNRDLEALEPGALTSLLMISLNAPAHYLIFEKFLMPPQMDHIPG